MSTTLADPCFLFLFFFCCCYLFVCLFLAKPGSQLKPDFSSILFRAVRKGLAGELGEVALNLVYFSISLHPLGKIK